MFQQTKVVESQTATRTRDAQKADFAKILSDEGAPNETLAAELEDAAFRLSKGESTREYRTRVSTVKMRLKGSRGALIRKALQENLLTAEQLMGMDMAKLTEESVQAFLNLNLSNPAQEPKITAPQPKQQNARAPPPQRGAPRPRPPQAVQTPKIDQEQENQFQISETPQEAPQTISTEVQKIPEQQPIPAEPIITQQEQVKVPDMEFQPQEEPQTQFQEVKDYSAEYNRQNDFLEDNDFPNILELQKNNEEIKKLAEQYPYSDEDQEDKGRYSPLPSDNLLNQEFIQDSQDQKVKNQDEEILDQQIVQDEQLYHDNDSFQKISENPLKQQYTDQYNQQQQEAAKEISQQQLNDQKQLIIAQQKAEQQEQQRKLEELQAQQKRDDLQKQKHELQQQQLYKKQQADQSSQLFLEEQRRKQEEQQEYFRKQDQARKIRQQQQQELFEQQKLQLEQTLNKQREQDLELARLRQIPLHSPSFKSQTLDVAYFEQLIKKRDAHYEAIIFQLKEQNARLQRETLPKSQNFEEQINIMKNLLQKINSPTVPRLTVPQTQFWANEEEVQPTVNADSGSTQIREYWQQQQERDEREEDLPLQQNNPRQILSQQQAPQNHQQQIQPVVVQQQHVVQQPVVHPEAQQQIATHQPQQIQVSTEQSQIKQQEQQQQQQQQQQSQSQQKQTQQISASQITQNFQQSSQDQLQYQNAKKSEIKEFTQQIQHDEQRTDPQLHQISEPSESDFFGQLSQQQSKPEIVQPQQAFGHPKLVNRKKTTDQPKPQPQRTVQQFQWEQQDEQGLSHTSSVASIQSARNRRGQIPGSLFG